MSTKNELFTGPSGAAKAEQNLLYRHDNVNCVLTSQHSQKLLPGPVPPSYPLLPGQDKTRRRKESEDRKNSYNGTLIGGMKGRGPRLFAFVKFYSNPFQYHLSYFSLSLSSLCIACLCIFLTRTGGTKEDDSKKSWAFQNIMFPLRVHLFC